MPVSGGLTVGVMTEGGSQFNPAQMTVWLPKTDAPTPSAWNSVRKTATDVASVPYDISRGASRAAATESPAVEASVAQLLAGSIPPSSRSWPTRAKSCGAAPVEAGDFVVAAWNQQQLGVNKVLVLLNSRLPTSIVAGEGNKVLSEYACQPLTGITTAFNLRCDIPLAEVTAERRYFIRHATWQRREYRAATTGDATMISDRLSRLLVRLARKVIPPATALAGTLSVIVAVGALWLLLSPFDTTFQVVAETERIVMTVNHQLPWRWTFERSILRHGMHQGAFSGSLQLGFPVEVTIERVGHGSLWIAIRHQTGQDHKCRSATLFGPDEEALEPVPCEFDITVSDIPGRAAQGQTTVLALEGEISAGRPLGFQTQGSGTALLRSGRVTLREATFISRRSYDASIQDLYAGDFFRVTEVNPEIIARGFIGVDERPAMTAAFRIVGKEGTVERPRRRRISDRQRHLFALRQRCGPPGADRDDRCGRRFDYSERRDLVEGLDRRGDEREEPGEERSPKTSV